MTILLNKNSGSYLSARLRQHSNSGDLNFPTRGLSLTNDVFDDNDAAKEISLDPVNQVSEMTERKQNEFLNSNKKGFTLKTDL